MFADQGISGFSRNRPEFQQMVQMAKDGQIDLIITKSISRFARNAAILLETVRELRLIGAAVYFEEHNINTLSGDGEVMLTVLALFAEEESRNVSENRKWSIRKKFERGEYMINTERFMGYDKDELGNWSSILKRPWQSGSLLICTFWEWVPAVWGSWQIFWEFRP